MELRGVHPGSAKRNQLVGKKLERVKGGMNVLKPEAQRRAASLEGQGDMRPQGKKLGRAKPQGSPRETRRGRSGNQKRKGKKSPEGFL